MANAMRLAFVAVLVIAGFVDKLNAACTDCAENGGEYDATCNECICKAMSECKPKYLFQDDAAKYVYGYMGINARTWDQCENPGSEDGLDFIGCARNRNCAGRCVDRYTERFYGNCDSNYGPDCKMCCKQAAYLRLNLKNNCMNPDGDKFWAKVEACLTAPTPNPSSEDCLCFVKGKNKKRTSPGDSADQTRSTRNECHYSTGGFDEHEGEKWWQYTDYDGKTRWSKADAMVKTPFEQRDQCRMAVCYRLTKNQPALYDKEMTGFQDFSHDRLFNMFGTGKVTEQEGVIYVQFVSYKTNTGILFTSWVERDHTIIDSFENCTGKPQPAAVEKSCYCIVDPNGAQLRNSSFPRGPYKVREALPGECFNTPNSYVRRAAPDGDVANYVTFRDPDNSGMMWTPDVRGLQFPDSYCSGLKPTRTCLKAKRNWDRVLRYLSSPEEDKISLEGGDTYWATGNVEEYDGLTWLEFYYDHEYITYWVQEDKVFVPFSRECSGKLRDMPTQQYCTCFTESDKVIRSSFRLGKTNTLSSTVKSVEGECYVATGRFYPKKAVQWQEFIHPVHGLVVAKEGSQKMSLKSTCGL